MSRAENSAAFQAWKKRDFAKGTMKIYKPRLLHFFEVMHLDPDAFVKLDKQKAEDIISQYVDRELRPKFDSGEFKQNTILGYVSPLVKFTTHHRMNLDWKWIWDQVPKRGLRSGGDRFPTREEIRTILTQCHPRERAAFLILASSGVRISSLPFMQVKHFKRKPETGETRGAELQAFNAKKNRWYTTFINAEAWNALEGYLRERKAWGENIGPESFVFRNVFRHPRRSSLTAKDGEKLSLWGIRDMINDMERRAKVRDIQERKGKRVRYTWMMAHAFRKRFNTLAKQKMDALNVEILLDHDIGLDKNYLRPNMDVVFLDYLRAAPDLTVTGDFIPVAPLEAVEKQEKLLKELAARVGELEEENVGLGRLLDYWLPKKVDLSKVNLSKPREITPAEYLRKIAAGKRPVWVDEKGNIGGWGGPPEPDDTGESKEK